MKRIIYIVFMLGLIYASLWIVCDFSASEKAPDFVELDVDYAINDDGTYTCRNAIYDYRMEVMGIEGEKQVTFVILTNDKETSFDDVAASMIKAEMSKGVPQFVILGWYLTK